MLFLVVRVLSWERNPSKRLVKAPKVFLPDSGLLNYFTASSAEGLLAKPGLPGPMVETFVPAKLLKHVTFSAERLSPWHYRTLTPIEVDFVLENRLGQITGIKVKASATVDGKDFKGLRHLAETESAIFCMASFYAQVVKWCRLATNCGPCRCPSGGAPCEQSRWGQKSKLRQVA